MRTISSSVGSRAGTACEEAVEEVGERIRVVARPARGTSSTSGASPRAVARRELVEEGRRRLVHAASLRSFASAR